MRVVVFGSLYLVDPDRKCYDNIAIMNGKKLLIVEDEQDIRELYSEILRDEGYEVTEAWDGEVGLKTALSGKFDIILLDVMLPKVDGLRILKEIKKKPELSKIPIILLTNLGADAVIKEAFTLGAEAYVIKSEYTPDQVINEVNKVFTQEAAA